MDRQNRSRSQSALGKKQGMTPKQEAAARQALEALEKIGLRGWVERKEAAITALREALAEQQAAEPSDEDIERILAQTLDEVAKHYGFMHAFDVQADIARNTYLRNAFARAVLNAAPTQQPVLVRDLAEILGATVPEVCDALAECGVPRRSTNMAVSGLEAVAVAAMLKQAAEPARQSIEFLMRGEKMAFKIGAQQFTLDYEPSDPGEFDFMRNMLTSAISSITPDVKPAQQPLTDEQCDAIYTALDEWSREVDAHEFGLPAIAGGGMGKGREIIRAAHGITSKKGGAA